MAFDLRINDMRTESAPPDGPGKQASRPPLDEVSLRPTRIAATNPATSVALALRLAGIPPARAFPSSQTWQLPFGDQGLSHAQDMSPPRMDGHSGLFASCPTGGCAATNFDADCL